MKTYAHSFPDKPTSEWETLEAHSVRVGNAARERACWFHGGDTAMALGLLHDLGKAKSAFQDKLQGDANQESHSGEGARVLHEMDGFAGTLAGAITGHHGRLPDPDRLESRLEAAQQIDLPDWCALPAIAPTSHLMSASKEDAPYRLQFLVRMLYGALTDADDRETGYFYAEAEGRSVATRPTMVKEALRATLDTHLEGLGGTGDVNDLRRTVLSHARKQADLDPGLFTLTVPTGGGKTLTSLAFALDHALRHGLRRLIYVIPYTSIVEQTADCPSSGFFGLRGPFCNGGSGSVSV